MAGQAWLLLLLTLLLAAWLVSHALVLWLALRAENVPRKWRVLALVPPVAPLVAWASGRRVAPVLWALLGVTYVGLRLV